MADDAVQSGLGMEVAVTLVAKPDTKEIDKSLKSKVTSDLDKLLGDLSSQTQAVNNLFQNVSTVLSAAVSKNSKLASKTDISEFQRLAKTLEQLTKIDPGDSGTTGVARQELIGSTINRMQEHLLRIPSMVNPRKKGEVKTPVLDASQIESQIKSSLQKYNSAVQNIAKATDLDVAPADSELTARTRSATASVDSYMKTRTALLDKISAKLLETERAESQRIVEIRRSQAERLQRQRIGNRLTSAGVPELSGLVLDMETATKRDDLWALSWQSKAAGSKTMYRDLKADNITPSELHKAIVKGVPDKADGTLSTIMQSFYDDFVKTSGGDLNKLELPQLIGQNIGSADWEWLKKAAVRLPDGDLKGKVEGLFERLKSNKSGLVDTQNLWVDFLRRDVGELGILDRFSGGAKLSNITAALDIPLTAHNVEADQEATALVARYLSSPEGRAQAKDQFNKNRHKWLASIEESLKGDELRKIAGQDDKLYTELLKYSEARRSAVGADRFSLAVQNPQLESLVQDAEFSARQAYSNFTARLSEGRKSSQVVDATTMASAKEAYENLHKEAITRITAAINSELMGAKPQDLATQSGINALASKVAKSAEVEAPLNDILKAYGSVAETQKNAFHFNVSSAIEGAIGTMIRPLDRSHVVKSLKVKPATAERLGAQLNEDGTLQGYSLYEMADGSSVALTQSQVDEIRSRREGVLKHINDTVYKNIISSLQKVPEANIAPPPPEIGGQQWVDKGTIRATYIAGNAVGRPGMDEAHLKEVYAKGGYMYNPPKDATQLGNYFEKLAVKWLQENRPDLAMGFTGAAGQQELNLGPVTGHPDAFMLDRSSGLPAIGEFKYSGLDKLERVRKNGPEMDWQVQTNLYALMAGLGPDAVFKYYTGSVKRSDATLKRLEAMLASMPADARGKEDVKSRIAQRKAELDEQIRNTPEEEREKFYELDHLEEITVKANPEIQQRILGTISSITGIAKEKLKAGGLNKDILEFYQTALQSGEKVNTADLAKWGAEVAKQLGKPRHETLKMAESIQTAIAQISEDLKITGEKPPIPPDIATAPPATPPEDRRVKLEKDRAILEKLRAKADSDSRRYLNMHKAVADYIETRKALGAPIESAMSERVDKVAELRHKAEENYRLRNQYDKLLGKVNDELDNVRASQDYTSSEAIDVSALVYAHKQEIQNKERVQELKDRALELAGANRHDPTIKNLDEAHKVAAELAKTGVKAGSSMVDISRSKVALLDSEHAQNLNRLNVFGGESEIFKGLIDSASLSKFKGDKPSMMAQVGVYQQAQAGLDKLWNTLHKASGKTFVSDTLAQLDNLGAVIETAASHVSKLTLEERKLKEAHKDAILRGDSKESISELDQQIQAVTERRKKELVELRGYMKEASQLTESMRPVKDFKNVSADERKALAQDIIGQRQRELNQLEMRKAQLETEIGMKGFGLTESNYAELGRVNTEIEKRGRGKYGLTNVKLSEMGVEQGWAPIPSDKPQFKAGLELKLLTAQAKEEAERFKVSLQKEAVRLKVDIDLNGLTAQNFQAAVQNAVELAKKGIKTPGYGLDKLIAKSNKEGVRITEDLEAYQGESDGLKMEQVMARFKKTATLGADWVGSQKAALDESVQRMYGELAQSQDVSGKLDPALQKMETEALDSLNLLRDLRAKRQLLEQTAKDVEKTSPDRAKEFQSQADELRKLENQARVKAESHVEAYGAEVDKRKLTYGVDNLEVQDKIRKSVEREVSLEQDLLRIEKLRLETKMDLKAADAGEVRKLIEINSELNRRGHNTGQNTDDILKKAQGANVPMQEVNPNRKGRTFVEGAIGLLDWQMQWLAGVAVLGAFNAVITNSVSFAIQFEQELKNIQLITQANTVEMTGLVDSVTNLATRFQYSASELGQALVILGQAGFDAIESLQLLPNITALATATMTTLAVAADITTTAIEAFNVPVEDSAQLVNSLAAMTIESKLDLEKLGTTFNYVAETASAAGLSVEETGTAMGLMSNAGVRASTIGTSLRSVLGSLMNPTAAFSAELAKVGLSVEDISPLTHDFGEILKTLNEAGFSVSEAFKGLDKRIAGATTTLVNSAGNWDEFEGKITGTNRAFAMAEGQMDTLHSQVLKLRNTFQVTAGSIWEPTLKPMKEGVSLLNTAMSLMHSGIKAVPPSVWSMAVGGLGLTSTVSVISGVLSGIKELRDEGIAQKRGSGTLQGMNRTLATTVATFFDPKLLGVGLGLAAAYMSISKAIDETSGAAQLARTVKMTDSLKAQSDEIGRQIKLYKEAGYATTQWADAKRRLLELGAPKDLSDKELDSFKASAALDYRRAKSRVGSQTMEEATSWWSQLKFPLKSSEEQQSYIKAKADKLMEFYRGEGLTYTDDPARLEQFFTEHKIDKTDELSTRIRQEFLGLREEVLQDPDMLNKKHGVAGSSMLDALSVLKDLTKESKVEVAYKREVERLRSSMAGTPDASASDESLIAFEDFKKTYAAQREKDRKKNAERLEAMAVEYMQTSADGGKRSGTQKILQTKAASLTEKYEAIKDDIRFAGQLLAQGEISKEAYDALLELQEKNLTTQETNMVALARQLVILDKLPNLGAQEAKMVQDLARFVMRDGKLFGAVSAANFSDFQKKVVSIEEERLKALSLVGKENSPEKLKLRQSINVSFDLKVTELAESEIEASYAKVEKWFSKAREGLKKQADIDINRRKEILSLYKTVASADLEMATSHLQSMQPVEYVRSSVGNTSFNAPVDTYGLTPITVLSEERKTRMQLGLEQDIARQQALVQEASYQDARKALVAKYNDEIAVLEKTMNTKDGLGYRIRLEKHQQFLDELAKLEETRRAEMGEQIDSISKRYSKVADEIRKINDAWQESSKSFSDLLEKLKEAAGIKDNTKMGFDINTINSELDRNMQKAMILYRSGDTSQAKKYETEAQSVVTQGLSAGNLSQKEIVAIKDNVERWMMQRREVVTESELNLQDKLYGLQAERNVAEQNLKRLSPGYTGGTGFIETEDGKRLELSTQKLKLGKLPEGFTQGMLTPGETGPVTPEERKRIEQLLDAQYSQRGSLYQEATTSLQTVNPKLIDQVYEAVQKHGDILVTNFNKLSETLVQVVGVIKDTADGLAEAKKARDDEAKKRAEEGEKPAPASTEVKIAFKDNAIDLITAQVETKLTDRLTGLKSY